MHICSHFTLKQCAIDLTQKVGCDLMLESGAIPDRCGICGGDGSTCAPITFTDMKPYDWQGECK